jgi:hypothetical protein
MARTADVNFQSFLTRTGRMQRLTTEQLYDLAIARNLKLTKSRKKDASRPSQFAWQHQLRRDQHVLVNAGTYRRYANGTWGTPRGI